MSKLNRRIVYLAVVAIAQAATVAVAVPVTIFKDDFQSDVAGQTGSGGDLDPEIGVGDIGGSWTIRESTSEHCRVINDTVPITDTTPGLNNYLEMIRGGSSSSIAKPYGTGWTTADTLNRTVQLDFDVWQQTDNLITVWLFNAAPPTTVGGFPSLATMAAAQDLDTEIPDEVWSTVRIIANLSSTETQFGVLPQRYTLSIDGGAPSDFPFDSTGGDVNQIRSLGFYTGALNLTEYIDNVQLQILNPGVEGDYNGDNQVDAADYVIWRKNNGLMGGATIADGDGTGDGNVDSADYTYWRERFGNPPPGSGTGLNATTVPEPASLAIVLAVVSGTLCIRRFRNCKRATCA